jgi:proliferating cell nuclear antigen
LNENQKQPDAQALAELAQAIATVKKAEVFLETHCPKCKKPKSYRLRDGTQVEHKHIVPDRPVRDDLDLISPERLWKQRSDRIIHPDEIPLDAPAKAAPGHRQFTMRFPSAYLFDNIIKIAKSVVEETNFEVSPNGLGFRTMDSSHVSLVNILIAPSSFEKFEADVVSKFAVRTEDFVRLLAAAEKKEGLELRMDDQQQEDTLLFRLLDSTRMEYELHLIESFSGETPLPRLEYDTTAVVTVRLLLKIIKKLKAIGGRPNSDISITIAATKDEISFGGESEVGKGSSEFSKLDAEVLDLQCRQDSKSTYSADYLGAFLKASKGLGEVVILDFSTNRPLRVRYKIDDTGYSLHIQDEVRSYVDYYLAPRVSDDYYLAPRVSDLPAPQPQPATESSTAPAGDEDADEDGIDDPEVCKNCGLYSEDHDEEDYCLNAEGERWETLTKYEPRGDQQEPTPDYSIPAAEAAELVGPQTETQPGPEEGPARG